MTDRNVNTLRKQDWFHPDGFPIAVIYREPQAPFGPHTHEFSELVVVTGGSGRHVTGSESWPLSPGDVFVIGGPREHEYRDLHDLSLVNILFDPQKLHIDWWDLPRLSGFHALLAIEPSWRRRHQFKSRLHLQQKNLEHICGLVDRLHAELLGRKAGFEFVATSWFMQILAFVVRHYSQTPNPDSSAVRRIAEAMTHLETHFTQTVDLDDLAALTRMSKRSFLRAFRAATGESPISYLIQLRVRKAAERLRRRNESITDIAFQVGFTDSNYFSRQFRQVIGLSPAAYRKRFQSINARP